MTVQTPIPDFNAARLAMLIAETEAVAVESHPAVESSGHDIVIFRGPIPAEEPQAP